MATYLWTKLSSARWRDAWEERLHALEDSSLVITEFAGRPTIRIEVYARTRGAAEQIRREFGGTVRRLAETDWVAATSEPRKPISIRDRIVVAVTDDTRQLDALRRAHPDRHVLSIPARMAFGTGDHATTATCLRLLCDLAADGTLRPGFRCLDLGTGTGILAIAAKKLGAGTTKAWDFDPVAVRIARENAAANGTPGITFARRDATQWTPGPRDQWDLILGNLFSNVLAATFPAMRRALAPDGVAVVSGILAEHSGECLAAGRRAGLRFDPVLKRGKWVTAVGRPARTARSPS